jgi:hypothetical protein
VIKGIFSSIEGAIHTVATVWDGLLDTIKNGARLLGAVATGDWGKAWDILTGKESSSTDAMRNDFGNFQNALGTVIDYNKQKLSEHGIAFDETATKASNAASGGLATASNSFSTLEKNTGSATTALSTFNSTPVTDKNTSSNADDIAAAFRRAKSALDTYNNTPVYPKDIPTQSGAAYAHGTDYHPGGPALVGEEEPERVEVDGKSFAVMGPTWFSNLARGAKVKPLNLSAKIFTGAKGSQPSSGFGPGDEHLAGNISHHYDQRTIISVDANYQNQPRESLLEDLKLLQMLGSRT